MDHYLCRLSACPVCIRPSKSSRAFGNLSAGKEQGYLTFDDLNEALPEGITDAGRMDLILTRLRRLEIDIIEASEVDRYRAARKTLMMRRTKRKAGASKG